MRPAWEKIPEELRALPQWVCTDRRHKIPMQAKQMFAASCSDPATWCDFSTALAAVNAGRYDGLGFVFADNGIVGIDIDNGYDGAGFLTPLALWTIRQCGSFVEKSRSGRGVHIYVKGTLPFKGRNNRRGMEIYRTGRYFIVTGQRLTKNGLIENQRGVDAVLERCFSMDAPAASPNVSGSSLSSFSSLEYRPVWRRPSARRIPLRPEYPEILQGCRNLTLTSIAGGLHTTGYKKKYIYKEMQDINMQSCKPPLDEGELQTIVNSVLRYPGSRKGRDG